MEILGLQILYEILTYKKLRSSQIPGPVVERMTSRVNQVKSFEDEGGQNAAMNVIYLNLVMLIMLHCKPLLKLVNLNTFPEIVNRMVRAEEYALYQKLLINFMAVLLDERNNIVDERQKTSIKEKFNILYMDILAVNTLTLIEDIWVGLVHQPLELSNYIEHWLEAVVKEQQVVFPIFPRSAVYLKI